MRAAAHRAEEIIQVPKGDERNESGGGREELAGGKVIKS